MARISERLGKQSQEYARSPISELVTKIRQNSTSKTDLRWEGLTTAYSTSHNTISKGGPAGFPEGVHYCISEVHGLQLIIAKINVLNLYQPT